MKRLILIVVLLLAVTGVTGCDDKKAAAGPVRDDASSVIDCGRTKDVQAAYGDPSMLPKEIVCMQRALAAFRPAEVTLLSVHATDSGPYDWTYGLDRAQHVSLTINVSEDAPEGSKEPARHIECTKPEWLPGAICPLPPLPKTRPAPFTVAPDQRVTAETRYVEVLVHPTHCTEGRTGTVLAPTVERSHGQVRVLYRVANRPTHVGHCGPGSAVRARLDLRAPLADRWIVDSSCIMPSVYWREVCRKTKIRARAD